MNKYKKIATAVVATVMAGTMVASLAACGPKEADVKLRSTDIPTTRFNAAASELTEQAVGDLKVTLKDGKLAYPAGTTVVSNIIDSGNADRAIGFDASQIAGSWTGLDGYTYSAGDLKPAWWQFGQNLGINFKDDKKTDRSGKELSTVGQNSEWANYNLINSSVGAINANTTNLVDLSKFLQYMPNFKAFLEQYPIVEWSLKMNTDGAIYMIPYFDGNDDIEKYEMVQRDWVKKVLDDGVDASKAISYLDQYKAKVNGEATGITIDNLTAGQLHCTTGEANKYTVKTVNPSNKSQLIDLTVDYGAALTAAKDDTTALGKAVKDAAGVAYDGGASISLNHKESGNIVDLQNYAIVKTNGAVKGDALAKILQEYVKVAYKNGTSAFYTTLSDVFLSSSGAWDADLMVAMFRCVVTNFKSFNGLADAQAKEVWALAGREMKAQRENDLIALAGELFGVRGMESRLEYMYIDANGDMKDARQDEASYAAALWLNGLANEGLLFNKAEATSATINKKYAAGKNVTFMLHDYAQTQTTDGFKSADFDFAPIVTPVSYWCDNTEDEYEYMRFTESWRSVKNSGVVIPKASVSDPKTLSAVLSFVDYLFSNDGQIVGSYGPMSTNGNVAEADGFWYGNNGESILGEDGKPIAKFKDKVATNDNVQYYLKAANKGEGFIYNNTFYKGLDYNGRQIPIMTDNNKNFYLGKEVNGNKMDTKNEIGIKKDYVGNYTNYARGIVGAALPIGNKDQGFEYQCTADCGLKGAAVVNEALQAGAIKHVQQTVDSNNWWYTECPTCLPTTSQQASDLDKQTKIMGASKTVGVFNPTSTAGYSNVYIDLAFWGLATSGNAYMVGTNHAAENNDAIAMATSISDLLTAINGITTTGGNLADRLTWYSAAWNALKAGNAD